MGTSQCYKWGRWVGYCEIHTEIFGAWGGSVLSCGCEACQRSPSQDVADFSITSACWGPRDGTLASEQAVSMGGEGKKYLNRAFQNFWGDLEGGKTVEAHLDNLQNVNQSGVIWQTHHWAEYFLEGLPEGTRHSPSTSGQHLSAEAKIQKCGRERS